MEASVTVLVTILLRIRIKRFYVRSAARNTRLEVVMKDIRPPIVVNMQTVKSLLIQLCWMKSSTLLFWNWSKITEAHSEILRQELSSYRFESLDNWYTKKGSVEKFYGKYHTTVAKTFWEIQWPEMQHSFCQSKSQIVCSHTAIKQSHQVKKSWTLYCQTRVVYWSQQVIVRDISLFKCNQGFAPQPCCMAGTIGSFPMGTNVPSNANNFHCPAMQHGCRAKPL